MILIQAVLIIAFLVLLARFMSNPSSYQIRAGSKLFMILLVTLAIFVIIFPDTSNTIARWFGVKYGVNLLVYMLGLAFTFLVLHLYVREKREQARLVQLARNFALLEAELRYQKTGTSQKE